MSSNVWRYAILLCGVLEIEIMGVVSFVLNPDCQLGAQDPDSNIVCGWPLSGHFNGGRYSNYACGINGRGLQTSHEIGLLHMWMCHH